MTQLQVLLVRDEELEGGVSILPHILIIARDISSLAAKNGFQSVRSVHVYSVQKTRIQVSCGLFRCSAYSTSLVGQDSGTLFMANYDICKEHISTYSRSVHSNATGNYDVRISGADGVQLLALSLCHHLPLLTLIYRTLHPWRRMAALLWTRKTGFPNWT